MGSCVSHMRALESAAQESQRTLESHIGASDAQWTDEARRHFEAEHLAAIRSDARRLCVDLRAISTLVEDSTKQLANCC